MGRHRISRRDGSGRWSGAGSIAGVLRLQYPVQLTFAPPAAAKPNDCLVSVSVSSLAGDHRPQPLHCSQWCSRLNRQQRVYSDWSPNRRRMAGPPHIAVGRCDLIIPSGKAGYVALVEIQPPSLMLILAVRHHLADYYH